MASRDEAGYGPRVGRFASVENRDTLFRYDQRRDGTAQLMQRTFDELGKFKTLARHSSFLVSDIEEQRDVGAGRRHGRWREA